MKILGLLSSHDCSFCVLEDGYPVMHAELERYIRKKEPEGDAFSFFLDVCKGQNDIDVITVGYDFAQQMIDKFPEGMAKLLEYVDKNQVQTISYVGHHQSHAANAFYSSNFDNALVVTLDGGGIDVNLEGDLIPTSYTVWEGEGKKLKKNKIVHSELLNIGFAWQRITKLVFGLSSGYPRGNQAGTVMAMACMGDSQKYLDYFESFGFTNSAYMKDEPPYDDVFNFPKMNKIASSSEQAAFDIAAALQKATENKIKEIFDEIVQDTDKEYLCLSGGVVLNSVMTGKLFEWYGHIFKDIYVCPVSYDSGLAIGSAQYYWHHILEKPRIKWKDNFTPYMGEVYDHKQIINAINREDIEYTKVTDDTVIDLLLQQKIVSVFSGPSESGRRALGNRSILADPRSADMKDIINEKVKHRQWFRPFAPSILKDRVAEWFERDINSPYMSFVIKFKESVKEKVPAVVHFDGTARLQTVTEKDNKWYYNFLSKWESKTGVPILLNTSFNDREPIVETPSDAVNCFMGTDIDFLYFVDENILVSKKK